MSNVEVMIQPALLKWARERASLSVEQLGSKLGKSRADRVALWEDSPTAVPIPVRMLEKIAVSTHVPFGLLFLPEPPVESLPIQDFRSVDIAVRRRPSAGLLDTIYYYQRCQEWYREQLVSDGGKPLPFIGTATLNDGIEKLAEDIRKTVDIGTEKRQKLKDSTDVALWMIKCAQKVGINAVRSGVVGTNTHRPLDPDEFKGFALADEFAPYVFINGADWTSSQIFSLVHELVHLWLGQSAVADGDLSSVKLVPLERFCNEVAAEVLVPLAELRSKWNSHVSDSQNIEALRHHFKVSNQVVLIRSLAAQLINQNEYDQLRGGHQDAFLSKQHRTRKSGGNFYTTAVVRVGESFAREVVNSTLEGRTLYRDAFSLLQIRTSEQFRTLARRLNLEG